MDKIEHVILLMFENRSFDHMFGDFAGADGANAGNKNLHANLEYPQQPGAADRLGPGPDHDFSAVARQIAEVSDIAMGGFVVDYAQRRPHATQEQLEEVMRYFAHGKLSAFHKLAENFVLCDRWFASVPGPTWPNRLFALSGTSLGRVEMPDSLFNLNLHFYTQRTLFDALDEAQESWHVYCGDFPLSFLFTNQLKPSNAARYSRLSTFYRDVKLAYSANEKKKRDETKTDRAPFPSFVLVEPSYLWRDASDAHPPHDIQQADALLASVYNALRANDELWKKTLLVVLFDEHGGFYDHVPPPEARPPDAHAYDGFAFDRLGVRVPALLISPWVAEGKVLGSTSKDQALRTFDHTSLLRAISDRFDLSPPLGERAAAAQTFANNPKDAENDVFLEKMRDVPKGLLDGRARTPSVKVFEEIASGLSNAIVGLSHVLESNSDPPAELVKARSQQILSGHQSQFDIAMDRASDFIRGARAKVDTDR